jgi:hypothetical protein
VLRPRRYERLALAEERISELERHKASKESRVDFLLPAAVNLIQAMFVCFRDPGKRSDVVRIYLDQLPEVFDP